MNHGGYIPRPLGRSLPRYSVSGYPAAWAGGFILIIFSKNIVQFGICINVCDHVLGFFSTAHVTRAARYSSRFGVGWAAAIHRFARGILKDDAEGEDAVQESYLLAYRAMGTFSCCARWKK